MIIRKPASDISVPINVLINFSKIDGTKIVQIRDADGEAQKGVFIPLRNNNGMCMRNGRLTWMLVLIPRPHRKFTHIVAPFSRTYKQKELMRQSGQTVTTVSGYDAPVNNDFGSAFVKGRLLWKDFKELDDLREKNGNKRLYTEGGDTYGSV
ncbi:MAG: hypothetical protein HUK08_00185 [Bacteroidaceae bacterium]|nr:hypothetical protein [Bacteroidaceae bacterium]